MHPVFSETEMRTMRLMQFMRSPREICVPHTSVSRIGVSIRQHKVLLPSPLHCIKQHATYIKHAPSSCASIMLLHARSTPSALSWSRSPCTTRPSARSCCRPLQTQGACRHPSARAIQVGAAKLGVVCETLGTRPLFNACHVGQCRGKT